MTTNAAGASPVECRVRPRAWALPIADMAGGGDYLRSNPSAAGDAAAVLAWEPLYDRAALATLLAAETERCDGLARAAMSHAKDADWKRVERLLDALEAGPNVADERAAAFGRSA